MRTGLLRGRDSEVGASDDAQPGSPPSTPAGPGRRALPALAGVHAVAAGLLFKGPWVDDAWITLRYARNFAAGHFLVFNPGGPRIEGYSDPLWMIAEAVLFVLRLPPGPSVFGISLAALAGAAALTVSHAHRVGGTSGAAITCGLVWLVYAWPGFWDGMLNGLEGPLYALLLIALVIRALDPTSTPLSIVGWGMALSLCRFEGLVIAGAFAAVLAVDPGRVRRSRWLPLAGMAVWATMVTLVRLALFGRPVPMSVTAKSVDWGAVLRSPAGAPVRTNAGSRLIDGIDYLLAFVRRPTLIVLWLGALVLIARAESAQRRRILLIAGPPFAAGTLIAVQNGGDWMPGFRLLSPYLLAAIPVLSLLWARRRIVHPATLNTRWMITAIAVLTLVLPVAGLTSQGRPTRIATPWRSRPAAAAKGHYWNEVLPRDARYVSCCAGLLPFAAPDLSFTDYHGLISPCAAVSDALGTTLGRIDWDCAFAENAVIMDTNTYNFSRKLVTESIRRGDHYRIATCGSVGTLSGQGRDLALVRSDMVAAISSRDPSFRTMSARQWLADQPSFDRSLDGCATAPTGPGP